MPSLDKILNFGKVTVSQGYDANATQIVLVTGDGAKLPNPSTDGNFSLTWWNSTDYGDPADDPNKEIVRCTARDGDTLTITRAQEGTSATAKNLSGKTYKMVLAFTKFNYDKIVAGPDSATDGVPALFDGTTGKLLKNSTPTGTGNPVLANSPSLVTPDIGEATGTSLQLSGLTASEIVITDANKKLASANVNTYPSLTELSYVKGVTSAIQTQLDGKEAAGAVATHAALTETHGITAGGKILGSNDDIVFEIPSGIAIRKIKVKDQTADEHDGCDLQIFAGKGLNGTGGALCLYGGDGHGTNISGGPVVLGGGAPTGTGERGKVVIVSNNNSHYGIEIDTSAFTDNRTIVFPNTAGEIVLKDNAATITNKRIKKRVYSTTSASSLTPEISNYDIFEFTALASNITINNHSSSSPASGEMMEFIFHDNGTARSITWGSAYVNGGVALPSTTTAGKVLRVLVQWFPTDSKWQCVCAINEG